jgi:hypothetical protein
MLPARVGVSDGVMSDENEDRRKEVERRRDERVAAWAVECVEAVPQPDLSSGLA